MVVTARIRFALLGLTRLVADCKRNDRRVRHRRIRVNHLRVRKIIKLVYAWAGGQGTRQASGASPVNRGDVSRGLDLGAHPGPVLRGPRDT
jgi:hypothetical protein